VPFVQGAELAQEEINSGGGIDGRTVELVIEDNETRTPAALEAADKLVNVDGLNRIICGCFTILFFPLLEAHASGDVVFASNMSSSPELRNQPGNFASFIALDDVLVPRLTQFAWDQGNRTAGVLMTDDEYGQTIGPATVEAWTALGGELVLEETLQPGLGDYRAEMQRVADANPSMLFAITYQADAVLQFTELEELGWQGDVYVLYPSATAFGEIPGLDGRVYGIESRWLEEESADFRSAYTAANNEDPNYWSALGYDNVQLVARAIAAAASPSTEDFFAALDSVSSGYVGPSGEFAFDDDHIQSNPSLSFLVLQDGAWVPVE
jgi:branched-chain amino acid transport system substrate-binding protein